MAALRGETGELAPPQPSDWDAKSGLFARHFGSVVLSDLLVAPAEDESVCQSSLAASILGRGHHVVLIDLFAHYGTVRVSDGRAGGEEFSIELRRPQWMRFCGCLGEYGDEATARRLFDAVNQMRAASLDATRARLLHAGTGLLRSQTLQLSEEMALTCTAFSLSEFIEGVIRCACAPQTGTASPLRRLKLRAQRAGSLATGEASAGGALNAATLVREVERMLEEVAVPHARRLGLISSACLHHEMASVSMLSSTLRTLAPSFARLYACSSRGCDGISFPKFLRVAHHVAPGLDRARATRAFVQSLPTAVLFGLAAPGCARPSRNLSAAAFQQSLVRLAMLLAEEAILGSELTDADTPRALPSQMPDHQLIHLCAILQLIASSAESGPSSA